MLPKTDLPTFDVAIGDTKYTMTPMLVIDEKTLLMAKESADPTDTLRAVRDVVTRRTVGPSVADVSISALEYLFVRLYAQSVGSAVTVSYQDQDEQRPRDFTIDLLSVPAPDLSRKPKPIDGQGFRIVLRWPTAATYDAIGGTSIGLVAAGLDTIEKDGQTFRADESKWEERVAFVEQLDVRTFAAAVAELETMPTMLHEIRYTNDNGTERTIRLRSLSDFFTLR